MSIALREAIAVVQGCLCWGICTLLDQLILFLQVTHNGCAVLHICINWEFHLVSESVYKW